MKKYISYLVFANLLLLLFYFINKFQFVHNFNKILRVVVIEPVLFGTFIFYILRPLKNFFKKKGLSDKISICFTLLLSITVVTAIFYYFVRYLNRELVLLKKYLLSFSNDMDIINIMDGYISSFSIRKLPNTYLQMIIKYIRYLILNTKDIFNNGMMIFSNLLLVLLIIYFLLKDGHKFKDSVIKFIPNKYKEVSSCILSKCDKVLSSYVIGQATVAFSLAFMVFIGYKIINMPHGLLLAFITFILAFIPFVGFFVSMIVPYIIAITMGIGMIVKLSLLLIIAQTLKGRIVVPFIMGRVMKIHPLTDIFLVVIAATVIGPIGAFCIVPVYSVIKIAIETLRDKGYLRIVDKINKV